MVCLRTGERVTVSTGDDPEKDFLLALAQLQLGEVDHLRGEIHGWIVEDFHRQLA